MRRLQYQIPLLFLFFLLTSTVLVAQTQLTVTMSSTPACSLSGSITAAVGNGTPPYTYVWYMNSGTVTTTTNTLTNLSGGYYYVQVTDANQLNGWGQISLAHPFNLSVNATNEMCGDGSGTATASVVSGGTPPFTYTWNNGMTGSSISGLHAGGYEVTVTDANGCFVASEQDSMLTAWVQNGTPITGTVSTVGSTCTNGSASVINLAGGTAPYSYYWNTVPVQTTATATNLAGGTYTSVLITDAAGCQLTRYFYINQLPNGLSLNMSHVDETCVQANGGASVIASGGTPPYTYLWSNGATTSSVSGLSYGSYTVTVTDANLCPQGSYVYIHRTDPLTLSFTTTPPNCSNAGGVATVNVSGGAGPYTYLWSNGATTNALTNMGMGYWGVTVTDANGCYDHAWVQLTLPQSCYGTISGSIVGDANNNCVDDMGDFNFANHWVTVGGYYAITDANGDYSRDVIPGNYVIAQPWTPTYFAQACPVSPSTYTVNGLVAQQVVTGQDFFDYPSTVVNDLGIYIYAQPARPTANQQVTIYYYNSGSTVQNAVVEYVHDALMTLVTGGAQLSNYSSSTRTLTYNLGLIAPQQSGSVHCTFSIPTSTPLGTAYIQSAQILPISGDAYPLNNQDSVPGIVVASYDPNAKSVTPDGQITNDDSILTYRVQFQNTGNDTAFTVMVEDVIDPSLNIFSLEVLGASHAYTMDADAPGVVHFRFDNIMLPDSNINEAASHGEIIYRIHLKPNLPLGTQIHNTAGIYFDYNAPVITNTTLNYLGTLTAVDASVGTEAAFTLFPNPASDQVSLRFSDSWEGQTTISVRDLSGRLLHQAALDPTQDRNVQLDLQALSSGVYLVECMSQGQRMVRKLVLQ